MNSRHNSCYDELPPKLEAIRKIRKQPFYDLRVYDTRQLFVMDYSASHRLWFVGTGDYVWDWMSECRTYAYLLYKSYNVRGLPL